MYYVHVRSEELPSPLKSVSYNHEQPVFALAHIWKLHNSKVLLCMGFPKENSDRIPLRQSLTRHHHLQNYMSVMKPFLRLIPPVSINCHN